MFEDVLFGSNDSKAKIKKTATMVVSLLLHATVIFAVVVGPLMKTDQVLPDIKVVDIFVAQTPPPPPNAQRGRKKSKSKTKREEKKRDEVKKDIPQQVGALVAPVEIPEEIIEEEEDISFDDGGSDDGVEGGVEGMDDDSNIGGDIIGDGAMGKGSITRISLRQAKRIHSVDPVYPRVALQAHVTGTVVIDAVTDVFGNVVSWTVISGHPLLNGAAINAIKKWKYEPYMLGGIPKPVRFRVDIVFNQK